MKKTDTNGIAIYCNYEKLMNYDDLLPNPQNPNKHTIEQIKLLADVIRANGWRTAVTVSDLSGYIVRGEGRYEAAKVLECQIPIEVQHYGTQEQEMADLIADNQIAQLSSQDKEELATIFSEMDLTALDKNATGFTEKEILEIQKTVNREVEALDLEEEKRDEEAAVVICPKCGFEYEI